MSELSIEEIMQELHQAAIRGGTPLHRVSDFPVDHPLAQEWKLFKERVRELIHTGEQGRFALVKGTSLTIWDTFRDAEMAGRLLHGPERFLVQEIQVYVKPLRWGYYRVCNKS